MKGPMPTGTSTPARGTCRSEVRLLALLTELSAGGRCWNGSRGGRGPFSPGRVNEGVKMSGAPDSIPPVLVKGPARGSNCRLRSLSSNDCHGQLEMVTCWVLTCEELGQTQGCCPVITASPDPQHRAAICIMGVPCLKQSHQARVRAFTEIYSLVVPPPSPVTLQGC